MPYVPTNRYYNRYIHSQWLYTLFNTPNILLTVPSCTNGDIRLVGGQSSREGRLEYCYLGEWSQICSNFQMEEAMVACKQLGFTNPPGKI